MARILGIHLRSSGERSVEIFPASGGASRTLSESRASKVQLSKIRSSSFFLNPDTWQLKYTGSPGPNAPPDGIVTTQAEVERNNHTPCKRPMQPGAHGGRMKSRELSSLSTSVG